MNLIKKQDFFLLEEVIRKNFSSKYKDSILGIVWSVLNPLLSVIVLTIVFSTLLGRGIENYPVYLLSGRCVFAYFAGTVGASMNIIKSNQNVLKRTSAPKYVFVIGTIISEFLNFIISFILLIIIMIVTNAPFHPSFMILSIIPIISLLILVTGSSLIMSILATYYTDIKHLWSIITQLLLYSSAIFYSMDTIPEPYHQYLILNPVFWAIDQFRAFMIIGTFPDMLNMVNLFLLSLIILILGIIIFEKYENKVIMKL